MEDILQGFLGDDDEAFVDEQLLTDFHLGNAINLDIIDSVVTGANPGYDLYVPHYYHQSWRKLREMIPLTNCPIIGMLEPTCAMMTLPFYRHAMSVSAYKEVVDIVSRGLANRGINIPISNKAKIIMEHDVTVKSIHYDIFHRTMMAISTLSERLRGGDKNIYTEVNYIDDFAVTVLLRDVRPMRLIVGRNMCAIVDVLEDQSYIGNYDSVLLLMDTVGQRMCLDIGLQITSICQVSGSVDVASVDKVISLGDKILALGGNDAYEVIAMFEPLVTSVILQKHPDIIGKSGEFYDNCVEELIELTTEMKKGEEIRSLWYQITEEISTYPKDWLSNIFTIYRIWGHPRVNILKGMEKVFSKGTVVKETVGKAESRTLCQFRHMFLQSYLQKHKTYPPIRVTGDPSYVTLRLMAGTPVDSTNRGFCILDYLNVVILKIWDIPQSYDTCHILNDKAVSPTRSELHESIRAGRGTIAGTLRRGLIRWMEGESIRCKEFLEHIDTHGLDDDSLIIGMYEKEREIKVKARMFSLMSEKMRMYFVLTEELIANHILPYFPEITMKDPLNVQIKKIWKVGGAGANDLCPNINIDFEKWNLNMREEFTDGLFSQLDTMFGFSRLISRTHEIFKSSLIYSCSGKYLPKTNGDSFIPDPPMLYTNHLGGFEGLRQKGWTVATVCLLAYSADRLNIRMNLLGQGDNQVIKLYMPTSKWDHLCYTREARERESRELTDNYIGEMDRNFEDAGLPIKVRETWISTRLFMYGKAMYLDGECLPQWNKKLLRSYALSNEGSLTISGVVGTIATNLSASAGVSDAPDIMYVIYLYMAEWSLRYLFNYHPFTRETLAPGQKYEFYMFNGTRKERIITSPLIIKRLLITLLTVPTAVGGNVTIPLTGFIMRGFPDHASEGYAWVKLLASVSSDYQEMFVNWFSFLRNPTVEADMLIQSPWSLNHKKPPTPGLQSRELVRDWLLSGRFRRNKFLTNMREINQFFDRKRICEELLSDVMNPLVTYEVYQSFPQAYYDGILRRFEGTRSVRKLAMREAYTKPVVKHLIELERRYNYYLYWRGEQRGDIYSACATAQARSARDVGWGRRIIGLTTPHPLEFLHDEICVGYPSECSGGDFILAKYYPGGKFAPYLGSRVKTKVASLQDETAKSEPLVKTCASLARYLKWLNIGENLYRVIKLSAESVCQTDIYDNFFDLDADSETYSGSVEHRFNPSAASDGCFINYVPQIGSSVHLSGDHMPKFGKGKENYTLHFQAIYCYLQYITSKSAAATSVHHHLRCDECIVPCEDQITDIKSHCPWIDLAFSEQAIPLLRDTIGYVNVKPQVFQPKEISGLIGIEEVPRNNISIASRVYNGVIVLLSLKCVLHIMHSKGGTREGLGLADLQQFPRVYAYKIYADHLIKTMASWILFLHGVSYEEEPKGYKLRTIKRKVLRTLSAAGQEVYSYAASLCVGRTDKGTDNIGTLVCANYPETVSDILFSVKESLIREVDLSNQVHDHMQRNMLLPRTDMTAIEQRMIFGFYSYLKYDCWSCAMIGSKTHPVLTNVCRGGHIYKLLHHVKLVPYSLDRAVKVMSIKRKSPYILGDIPLCSSVRINKKISREDILIRESLSDSRKITLPTSSIYKWSSVLSVCELEDVNHVVVLGDGTGGTSVVCASKWPEANIHPMAKMERFDILPQDTICLIPSLARGIPAVSTDMIESLGDDITDKGWINEFKKAILSLHGTVLVISDIEGCDQSFVELVMREIHSDTDAFLIFKIYNPSEEYANAGWVSITSQHANLHYGEMFLSNFNDWTEVLETEQSASSEEKSIEKGFPGLIQVTVKLVNRHLTSLLLNSSHSEFYEPETNLILLLTKFINMRFRFHQDRLKEQDDRNLSDGMLTKLNRLMVICISVHLPPRDRDFDMSLVGFIRRGDEERKKALRRFRIIPALTETKAELSQKDDIVIRTLRAYNKLRFDPETFDELLKMSLMNE